MRHHVFQMPIKWKLTLWSALLLFLLFGVYTAVQYFYIERWMIRQEQEDMQQSMNKILNYVLERESDLGDKDMLAIRGYLNRVVQNNQFVRISTTDGSRSIVVTGGLPIEQTSQAHVSAPQWTLDEERSLLILKSPFSIFEHEGTVELASDIREFQDMAAAFLRVMLVFGLGAILLSAWGGGLLAGQLLKPLQAMTVTIEKIRRNGLQERMHLIHRKDEIATLVRQFNEMMDQVERAFQQQSQFVQDASHELRTPIAIVEGHLALLRRWGKKDPQVLEESLEIAYHELGRLKQLVQDLLMLSQAEQEVDQEERLHARPLEVCTDVLQQLMFLHPSHEYQSELDSLAFVTISIPEAQLRQILLILLDNAVKYSQTGSRITIVGCVQGYKAGIEVTDLGIGIPQESIPYVMDRFYRVDAARSSERKGYGLGLAIARRLTERYGGTIEIHSELGKGTKVILMFSLSDLVQEGKG